jgi:hypothetical protein
MQPGSVEVCVSFPFSHFTSTVVVLDMCIVFSNCGVRLSGISGAGRRRRRKRRLTQLVAHTGECHGVRRFVDHGLHKEVGQPPGGPRRRASEVRRGQQVRRRLLLGVGRAGTDVDVQVAVVQAACGTAAVGRDPRVEFQPAEYHGLLNEPEDGSVHIGINAWLHGHDAEARLAGPGLERAHGQALDPEFLALPRAFAFGDPVGHCTVFSRRGYISGGMVSS